jgi:Putative Flp pilus-assembly TadE/G-like
MKMKKQSGQVLVGVALAFVVLAGFAGLAIDMGTLRYQRRLQQAAADAGAIAGAQNLDFKSGWVAGAQYAASQNGFTDGGAGAVSACEGNATIGTTCVQVNYPPASPPGTPFNGTNIAGGPHGGDNKYIEVIVAKVQPTFFMNVFGVTSKPVVARAVATNITGGTNVNCMWTLGPPTSAIVGLDATGNAHIRAPNCGIADNGNLDTTGNSYTIDAGTISVSGACLGGHCGSPNVVCENTGGTCPPLGGSPASSDPLCPNSSSCIQPPPDPGYSSDCPASGPCDWGSSANQVATIHPGKYDSISLGSNSTITMAPGIYYIDGSISGSGAGINFNGGATLVTEGYTAGCGGASPVNGVMIYFKNTSTMNKFAGGGDKLDLQMCPLNSAQSTPYDGMLMYQDPADTTQAWIGGDNNTVLYGTVYMPTTTINFYGNASFSMLGQTIAYSVATTGNPTVTLGTSPGGLTPAWLTRPILVE